LEAQKVPATVHAGCWGLGPELDPSCIDTDLPPDAKCELPLWAAQRLQQQQLASAHLPRHFSRRLADDIDADPTCVPLRHVSERFFDVGKKLHSITVSDRLRIVWDALKGRYRELLSKAHSAASSGSAALAFVSHLSVEERALFDRGRQSTASFRAWRYREGERLQQPPLHSSSSQEHAPAKRTRLQSGYTAQPGR
jgi:hypothetical protein